MVNLFDRGDGVAGMRAWRLTRFRYYLDFGVYPVIIVTLVLLSVWFARPSFAWLQWCVGGFVAWTLIEYWLHRLVFHGALPAIARMHGGHHADPTGWIGVPVWYSLGCFLAGGVPIVAVVGWDDGGAVVVGLLLGYLLYIGVHDAAHHRTSYLHAWFPQLRLNHLRHHYQDADSCFGVTSDLWDRVFGTRR
jgi:sterol desaturase/sphingolipid hydroxylase (fatty acid hydroxylase superfamily)